MSRSSCDYSTPNRGHFSVVGGWEYFLRFPYFFFCSSSQLKLLRRMKNWQKRIGPLLVKATGVWNPGPREDCQARFCERPKVQIWNSKKNGDREIQNGHKQMPDLQKRNQVQRKGNKIGDKHIQKGNQQRPNLQKKIHIQWRGKQKWTGVIAKERMRKEVAAETKGWKKGNIIGKLWGQSRKSTCQKVNESGVGEEKLSSIWKRTTGPKLQDQILEVANIWQEIASKFACKNPSNRECQKSSQGDQGIGIPGRNHQSQVKILEGCRKNVNVVWWKSHIEKKEQVERRKNLVGQDVHLMKQRRKRTEDKCKEGKAFWKSQAIPSNSKTSQELSSCKIYQIIKTKLNLSKLSKKSVKI